MNSRIIITFLILLSLFISNFLINYSFSNNHINDLIVIKEPLDNKDFIIKEEDYKVIKESKRYREFIIKDKLKIYYVGSYSPGHVCGQPQINSFFKKIQNIEYDVDIEGWYLDTGKTFLNNSKIREVSGYVIKDIRRYNPDVIYVTDDYAFEYIGIPLSRDFLILFSGINFSYDGYVFKYKDIIKEENMIGLDELVDLSRLYDLFRTAMIFPNKWYFINDKTDVSKYIFNNLIDELYKLGISYEVFDVKDTENFIDIIKRLNNRSPGLIVNNVHSLYSNDYKRQLDTISLSMLLIRYNKKHLDFSINNNLCSHGISISNGSDYNKMGYMVGELLIDILNKKKVNHKVIRLNSYVTINYKRINELSYYKDLLNYLGKVSKIISSY